MHNPVNSGNSKKILSASFDGSIRIWEVVSGECIAVFNNIPGLLFHGCKFAKLHLGSDLTDDEIKLLKLYSVPIAVIQLVF
jgi:WD40 repeat protein